MILLEKAYNSSEEFELFLYQASTTKKLLLKKYDDGEIEKQYKDSPYEAPIPEDWIQILKNGY